MHRNFKKEDLRKDKIFEAWIHQAPARKEDFGRIEFEEIYEGLTTVRETLGDGLCLDLVDGRKLRPMQVNAEVVSHIRRSDTLYVVMGRICTQWILLEIISIASLVEGHPGGAHLTFHPELMEANAREVH